MQSSGQTGVVSVDEAWHDETDSMADGVAAAAQAGCDSSYQKRNSIDGTNGVIWAARGAMSPSISDSRTCTIGSASLLLRSGRGMSPTELVARLTDWHTEVLPKAVITGNAWPRSSVG